MLISDAISSLLLLRLFRIRRSICSLTSQHVTMYITYSTSPPSL